MTTGTRPRHPIAGVTYRSADEADRLFASGAWTASTAGEAVRAAARVAGDRIGLVVGADRLTWADLDDRSEALAAGLLELGLRPGDRVVVQMGSGPAVVVTFFACFKAGLVPVCAVPQYRAYEIGALVDRSEAVAHLVEAGAAGSFDLVGFAEDIRAHHPTLQHLIVAGAEHHRPGTIDLADVESAGRPVRDRLAAAAPAPEDVLAFQLSGGTTGVPKIIPRFHAEYLAQAASFAERIALTDDDVVLWGLSVSHNAGMMLTLVPAVLRRARLVLLPRHDVDAFLTAVEEERVTFASCVGPIGAHLLQARPQDHDLSSLRYFMTLNRAGDFEGHLGVPVANLFGMTEGLVMFSHPDDPPGVRHTTVGRPTSPFEEIRVLEEDGDEPVPFGEIGELCFRGPSSLTGYYRDEVSTKEAFGPDGFVRTGDLVRACRIDGIECFAYEGRNKENIDRGAEKFGVVEIEEFICSHPAVTDVCVVGMPDAHLGERVCAFLVLEPDADAPSVTELGGFLLEQGLAKFKLPERIEVVAELPATRVGKTDRRALREAAVRLVAASKTGGG